MNTNKGNIVKQSGNDVEGCRSEKILVQPNMGVFLQCSVKVQLHGAIYRLDSFVLMLRYCANLKAIRYESTSLNIIVADKSHRVIVA